MLLIEPYAPQHLEEWNAFISASKNGTFLFNRHYMDYHSDRFEDASLLIRTENKLVSVLPASRHGRTLTSHGGLTYGGFVSNSAMSAGLMLEMTETVVKHLRADGIKELIYKAVPPIYHLMPAQEDLYAVFRLGAELCRRDALSVVESSAMGPLQSRRKRGARRAESRGVRISESSHWDEYWELLSSVLESRHHVAPVHSVDEIKSLAKAFPQNIRLFTASSDGQLIAGTVLFVSRCVVHVQYVASSEIGRANGALDLLFLDLLNRFKDHRYFDFGHSNEDDGRRLNSGLAEFKEGFGARTVAHDFYRLELE